VQEKDEQVLQALSRSKEEHEDLAGFLDFYRAVAAIQFEHKARISIDPGVHDVIAMRHRLENGLPQLTFDQLMIEPAGFADLVRRIVDVIVCHRVEWGELSAAEEEPPAEELMKLARESFDRGGQVTQAGCSSSGLITLAVEFALVPYLQRAAELLMPRLDESLWQRGHCPVCGAAPDFSVLDEESGARHLVCSRCTTQWRYVRLRCPFCGTSDHTKLRYFPSDDEVYRLYVCELCKHYLKTIDLRKVRRRVLVPVERAVTLAMDVAAQEKGYLP